MAGPEQIEYAGFLRRLAASVIDALLLVIILTPLNFFFRTSYFPAIDAEGDFLAPNAGFDWSGLLINDLLPMVLVIFFWVRYRATPGKQLMDCQIVDATTLDNLRPQQAVLRYVGYFLSLLPFGLGFFWIIWDRRKRGFHDLVAHTVVIRLPLGHIAAVEAEKPIEQLMKEVE